MMIVICIVLWAFLSALISIPILLFLRSDYELVDEDEEQDQVEEKQDEERSA